jgi:hypothetical protein
LKDMGRHGHVKVDGTVLDPEKSLACPSSRI